jgi:hypothetical protein
MTDEVSPRARKHPSARILGFKDRFVPRVRSGDTRHTIRAGFFWRVGMIAHLYEHVRHKEMRLIFRVPVSKVEEIKFAAAFQPAGSLMDVWIDSVMLSPDECERLARADGFSSFEDMTAFWAPELKKEPTWYGQVIHWDYDRRFAERKEKKS